MSLGTFPAFMDEQHIQQCINFVPYDQIRLKMILIFFIFFQGGGGTPNICQMHTFIKKALKITLFSSEFHTSGSTFS